MSAPPASTPQDVLVLGGAGFLGLHLIRRLQLAGITPRVVRRRRSNVLGLRKLHVPMVVADLDDAPSLLAAMSGQRTVFHLAGHYPKDSRTPEATLERGTRQMKTVLDSAAAAGVEHLIYVSSTATVAPAVSGPSTEHDLFPTAPAFGCYHRLKWEMEALALAERRFRVSVACPSACLGPGDLKVGTSALLVALARGLQPRCPDGFLSWVDVRDVAEGVYRQSVHPTPVPRVIFSAGNARLSSLMEMLGARYGVPGATILSPAEAVELADAEEELATLGHHRAWLSREIVDLLIHSVPLSGEFATEALGLGYRPLQETLDDFDQWARRLEVIPPAVTKEAFA